MTIYRNPTPTVDIVLLVRPPDEQPVFIARGWDGTKVQPNYQTVLIQRKNPPHGWALPGGFVNEGESFEDAAVREAKEEISLDITLVEQFHTYSDPKRDPRQHNSTTVFLATAKGTPVAADDAAALVIQPIQDILVSKTLVLAFDHKQILTDVFRYLSFGKRPWDKHF